MTKYELREVLHREMLFYYFALREPRLEIRADVEILCTCSFAVMFHYDLEQGAAKITKFKQKLKLL